jgi:uncharacterized protein involved in exopolysaccharide biosynthesis
MSQPSVPPDAEFDAETEVDLRSLWQRVRARWWLPVAGVVIGAILGVLVATGGGSSYSAAAIIYLGQPFTPSGGGQIQSLATNPRTANEIVHSEAAIRAAAAASGLRPSALRGNVSTRPIVQAGQPRNTSALVEVKVLASNRTKAAEAANSLSQTVIKQVSTYVTAKIALLEEQIGSSTNELAEIDARVRLANAQLALVQRSQTLSDTEKLIAVTNLNNTLSFSEQRRGTVQQELFQNQQLLSLARNVEESRVVQEAVGKSETATSRRNAAAIGALIGLLLGVLAAYLADPILARRNSSPAT